MTTDVLHSWGIDAQAEIERLREHAVILANTERYVERERCVQWVRDNYQDHPTIDGLCAAMLASRILPSL